MRNDVTGNHEVHSIFHKANQVWFYEKKTQTL